MSPHPRFLSVVAVACGGLLVWAWLARADIAAPEVHGNATPGAASVAPADAVVDAAVRPDETAGPGTTRTEASEPGGRELDAAVDVIRGIVVDESGAPVANAELSVDHPRIWTPSGRSDAAGAFAIARGDADTASRARVRCRHERYDEFVAWLRWGQTARVVLPSPIAVEVVVVDDHGALVEADNVHAEPADGRSSGNHSSCARDGAVWRANLRRGRYRITGTVPAPADATSIAPFTGELDGPFLPDPAAAAHYRRVAAGRPLIVSRPLVVVGPGPVRVQLVAMANGARRVCVVDAAGQPVAAASVQLVELGDGPALTASELYSYSELIALGAISREVGHWRTDERGEAELHGARSRAHRVRAEKDSHVSAVVDVTLDGSAPVVLTLLAAARGTGRVLAATQLAAAIAAGRCNQLIVETAGTPSAANGADRAVKGFRVERDGTFRFDGVSPGSCFFRVWGPSLLEAWSGPLPLAAGENAPVVLDFRGWRGSRSNSPTRRCPSRARRSTRRRGATGERPSGCGPRATRCGQARQPGARWWVSSTACRPSSTCLTARPPSSARSSSRPARCGCRSSTPAANRCRGCASRCSAAVANGRHPCSRTGTAAWSCAVAPAPGPWPRSSSPSGRPPRTAIRWPAATRGSWTSAPFRCAAAK
jgi:hypothetical protein